ncbi:hydroxyacylglutathione hydrolase [Colwellia asteriadis]
MTNTSTALTVTAIKAFNDNYIWAITSPRNNSLTLVDPGDANVCITFIEKYNLNLTHILITHHHHDHTGGIEALVKYTQNSTVNVYGPNNSKIIGLTHKVNQGDIVTLPELQCQFSIKELPGHTLDHIAYIHDDMVFCGDTLFSGGCGRLFEGTPAQMHHSLAKLTALPEHTLVYCAHEYTQANLEFAATVEPNNIMLQQYREKVLALRQQSQATIPTTIGIEKAINPFLRSNSNEVIASAKHYNPQCMSDEISVFAAIRAWKDNF